MTNMDTAHIREGLSRGMSLQTAGLAIERLCDALDAARAERGEWNAMLNEADDRAEAAEARIATALALDCCGCDHLVHVRRALTRDTE